MKTVGVFSEMKAFADDGPVKSFIIEEVLYDKKKIKKYLLSHKVIATCPRYAIDCVTGKEIRSSFRVITDGEFVWCDFLADHVMKYNIRLPQELIDKAMAASDG